jgi:hypothetical protein
LPTEVWSHNSQITHRTGQLCPDAPGGPTFNFNFPIWLAIAPSTRRRQGTMLSLAARAVRTWLKLDPLFAGYLPTQALRGQNMVACPGLPSLSWAATRRTQPRRVCARAAIRLRSLSCRTCRLPWVTMIVCLPGRDGKEAEHFGQLKAICGPSGRGEER